MLEHMKLGSSVSSDPLQWLMLERPPIPMENIADRQTEMYTMGFRLLSITDKAELNVKDETQKVVSLYFKRCSLVAYGDGYLYYQKRDILL